MTPFSRNSVPDSNQPLLEDLPLQRSLYSLTDISEQAAVVLRAVSGHFSHATETKEILRMQSIHFEARARLFKLLPPSVAEHSIPDNARHEASLLKIFDILNDLEICALHESGLSCIDCLKLAVIIESSIWNFFSEILKFQSHCHRNLQRIAALFESQRAELIALLARNPLLSEQTSRIENLDRLWEKKVLILDDDKQVGRLMAAIIDPISKCEVHCSAPEALNSLRRSHFDLVISDYEMPAMSGIDFFRQACEIDPELGRQFLYFSGNQDESFVIFADLHSIPRLAKPAKAPDIMEVVHQMLNLPEGVPP